MTAHAHDLPCQASLNSNAYGLLYDDVQAANPSHIFSEGSPMFSKLWLADARPTVLWLADARPTVLQC